MTDTTFQTLPWERHRWPVLAGVIAVSLLLVGLVVMPQLSPRVSGTEIQLRVAPFDPIDPFRGAYVDLGYPDLPELDFEGVEGIDRGTAYVQLRQEGDVWVSAGRIVRERPDEGLFLTCDDSGWRLSCGIESWFVDQSTAIDIERRMMDSGAIATVRVDRWGNASIVGLAPMGS